MSKEWKYQPSQVFDTLITADIVYYEILWLYFNNVKQGNVINNVYHNDNGNTDNSHCMKSVRIRSFSGRNTGKYGPEKLRKRALFTQRVILMTYKTIV